MFERFTRQAREVVEAAAEAAGSLGADKVGAEYLSLAIVTAAKPGPAVNVLREAGATREALERVIASGTRTPAFWQSSTSTWRRSSSGSSETSARGVEPAERQTGPHPVRARRQEGA